MPKGLVGSDSRQPSQVRYVFSPSLSLSLPSSLSPRLLSPSLLLSLSTSISILGRDTVWLIAGTQSVPGPGSRFSGCWLHPALDPPLARSTPRRPRTTPSRSPSWDLHNQGHVSLGLSFIPHLQALEIQDEGDPGKLGTLTIRPQAWLLDAEM